MQQFNFKYMSKIITTNNYEMWNAYKELMWNALRSLGFHNQEEDFLLLGKVKNAGWEEQKELEKELTPFNEQWANIDLDVIKVGGYYKKFSNKLEDYNASTDYYHIIEVNKEEDRVYLKKYSLQKHSVWTNIYDKDSEWARNFALKIISNQMIEITEDEYNEIVTLYNVLNDKFYGSRKDTGDSK